MVMEGVSLSSILVKLAMMMRLDNDDAQRFDCLVSWKRIADPRSEITMVVA
jgi:hypothetical protein